MLEFAIIAFVMTLLLSGMIAMGLLLVSANVLQQAADVGAQELARHPFSATESFDNALVDSGLFEEADLILQYNPGTGEVENSNGEGVDELPLINRLLFPLYVFDPDTVDSNGNQGVLRYPGAVVTNASNQPTVLIPIMSTDADGKQTIDEWRQVVEEIDPGDTGAGPYSLTSTNTQGLPGAGYVALRVNYPYQSAAMISYVRLDAGGNIVPSDQLISGDVTNLPVAASDSTVIDSASLPTGYSLAPAGSNNPAFGASVARGEFGLGEVFAFDGVVRPYRQVLSAQGIYRREVLVP